MTFLPVIDRELRAEARSPYHHWLRLTGAGAVLVYFVAVAQGFDGPSSFLGRQLFGALASASILLTLVLTPQLTADCLSREKREGTLGLLLLTPLTSSEIVVGKSVVHLLRALTVLTALAPLFVVPMLMGGVQAWEVSAALLGNLAAAMLGLAAGLLASSSSSEWMRAFVLAEFLALAMAVIAFPLGLIFGRLGGPVIGSAVLVGLATGNLWLVILSVSWRLKGNWQRELVAPPQPRWTLTFADSQFLGRVFRWNKGRTLDRNPIAWLQEYSWTARLTKWGWLLLAIFGQVFGSRNLMWVLIAAIAFAAVGSFRRELQAGSLELLLVTPVREHQLITGRLWGLFCHFLPAVMVWTTFRYFQHVVSPRSGVLVDDVLTLYSSLLALPAIGFALSFSRANLITAFLLCLVVGVFIPDWLADFVEGRTRWLGYRVHFSTLAFVLIQIAVTVAAAKQLHTRLVERRFLPRPAA